MRNKTLSLFLIFFLCVFSLTPANAADLLPPANVSCSFTLSGARCASSIIFSGSTLISGSTKTEWYFSIMKPGASPADVASYGPLIFIKGFGYVSGSIDLDYEMLLGLANNDPMATVLITARTFNQDNVTTPIIGQRAYLLLPEVKKFMTEAKAAAEVKAAAELKAKQEAEAKAAVELKAKQEAEAKAAVELKAKQEAAVLAAAKKKTTITCIKGKLTKKVTAVKPTCPSGYKVKK